MNDQVQSKINSLYDKVAARLFPILKADLPPKIKLKTLRAISRTKIPASRQVVFEQFAQFSDEEDAIRAVGELGGEDAAQALIARVRQPHGDNRDVMAEQLGRFKYPFVRECLTELLGDPDRHVRYQAVFSLFSFGGRDAALALCRYISDPDEWISMNILKILCRMKEHESIPFLADQFAKDQDLRRKAQILDRGASRLSE
ncbi:MAG TPA: HEAT repeat domain-containing protein, partial [Candidatus Ozemobacteraceae bacterium]|nr:HEAT repeat domain-containing protein [Candidatus Ozemobacteraceae bacterium]